jgi:hypothetical protein
MGAEDSLRFEKHMIDRWPRTNPVERALTLSRTRIVPTAITSCRLPAPAAEVETAFFRGVQRRNGHWVAVHQQEARP